jgi:DNA mismatch repair ATPase MutS
MERAATGEGPVRFEVDKQTWKDLDLFDQGKRGPIFLLFHKVKTTGGGDVLEQMLRQPSDERALLEDRRDTIRYFLEAGIDLQIGREQLERIEHYLNSYIPLFPRNGLELLLYRTRNQLKQSQHYYTVTTGVRTTVSLLRHLFEEISGWRVEGRPVSMAGVLSEMSGWIDDARVKKIVLGASRPLSVMDISRCDHFFRNGGKAVLRRMLALIYEWDVYQAVAKTTYQYKLSFPVYSDEPEPWVRAQGLFHPLVVNAVPNDYEMGGEANLCFISGANMAGKSTFLKSFGLAVYLAHCGFPVPAQAFGTTIFHGLITTVNLADSVSQGYSHFYAEVRRVKDVAQKIRENRRLVVIFDELFRGTNVKDATDASLRVIDALAGIEGCLFLVSTHIVEIAPRLATNPRIFFTCFASTMEGGIPWYSYKLQPGVSDERAGMTILHNEGVLQMLAEMRRH